MLGKPKLFDDLVSCYWCGTAAIAEPLFAQKKFGLPSSGLDA
jgi:hypothetical protein